MRRWRGKTSLRETPLGLPTLLTGSIRNPQEDEALAVTMSINATGFALHADDVALGSWGTDEVEIVPLGDRAFEFVAEGDRLIFVPDDLDAFTRRVFPDQGGRRRRKKPSRPTAAAKPSKPAKASTRKDDEPAAPASDTKVAEPTPAPPTAPAEAAKPKPKRRRAIQVSAMNVRRTSKPAAKPASTPASKPASKPATTYDLPNDPPSPEPSDGRWLRTLDTARRYGLFSLDRVPVDESLRGSEHRHTYDHRASATSGPGNHICTICGKVRIRRG